MKEIWLSVVWSWSSVQVELGGQLGVGRRAVELGLELGVGLLERAGLGPHRAGHPVDRAELVEDGALDAGDGVGLELEAAARVELLDGVDEPEDAVADEVGLLDVLGQADGHPAGDVLHQRRVVEDQLVADSRARLSPCSRPRGRSICAAADRLVVHRARPYARGWVASSTARSRSRLT